MYKCAFIYGYYMYRGCSSVYVSMYATVYMYGDWDMWIYVESS